MKLRWKTKPKTGSISPEITVPEGWNDLTRKQLLFVAKLMLRKINIADFRGIVLNRFAGIKVYPEYRVDENDNYAFRIKQGKQKYFITAGLYHELLKSVDFVTREPSLTSQLIPQFRLFSRRYAGPEQACYNISYSELIYAQLAAANFQNTKDARYLNELTSILYRPVRNYRKSDPDFDGDRRVPFSAYAFQRRAWWFRFLPANIKFAVYIFFSGSMAFMAEKHPNCFKENTRVSSNPKPADPVKPLMDLVPVMTKGDPTKNKEFYSSPAWDVFDAYESLINQNQNNNFS